MLILINLELPGEFSSQHYKDKEEIMLFIALNFLKQNQRTL